MKHPNKIHWRLYEVTAIVTPAAGAELNAAVVDALFIGSPLELHPIHTTVKPAGHMPAEVTVLVTAPERIGAARDGIAAALAGMPGRVHSAALMFEIADVACDVTDQVFCPRREQGCTRIVHKGQCGRDGAVRALSGGHSNRH